MIGGLATVSILVAILVILRKRRRRHGQYDAAGTPEVAEQVTHQSPLTEQSPHSPTLTPYRKHLMLDYTPVGTHLDIGAGDMREYESSATLPSPGPSSPAHREIMLGSTQQLALSESVVSWSNIGSETGSAPSSGPLSPGVSVSTTEVVGLRVEVENLRRVMREIRAERLEAPPEYVE